MAARPEFLSIATSPWSLKARWALQARNVDYLATHYSPVLGETALRYRLGRWTGRVTVPVLFVPDSPPITDSAEIARWADAHGSGPVRLFPEGRDVDLWIRHSEEILENSRRIMQQKLDSSPEAKQEYLPKSLRGIWGVSSPLAWLGFSFFASKYSDLGHDGLDRIRSLWRELRTTLSTPLSSPQAGGGGGGGAAEEGKLRPYIFESFSFADIAMAASFQLIFPASDEYLRYGPKTREAITDPEIGREFADLIAWRERIFEEHHYYSKKVRGEGRDEK